MKFLGALFLVLVALPVLADPPNAAGHSTRKTHRTVASESEDETRTHKTNEESNFEIRPSFDYAFISPSELNNLFSSGAQKLGINDQYKISGGSDFSIAAEYNFDRNFSAGLRMDYLSASTNAVQYKNGDSRATIQSSVSALPLYLIGTAKYPLPTAPRLAVGATGGFGIPLFYHANTDISASNIAALPAGTQSYSATPFTFFLSAFSSYEILKVLSARIEFGYRFLSSDSMKLTDNYGPTAKAGDLLTDDNGTKVNVNAGSFFMGAGVVIIL